MFCFAFQLTQDPDDDIVITTKDGTLEEQLLHNGTGTLGAIKILQDYFSNSGADPDTVQFKFQGKTVQFFESKSAEEVMRTLIQLRDYYYEWTSMKGGALAAYQEGPRIKVIREFLNTIGMTMHDLAALINYRVILEEC